jgi:hypothetical protein
MPRPVEVHLTQAIYDTLKGADGAPGAPGAPGADGARGLPGAAGPAGDGGAPMYWAHLRAASLISESNSVLLAPRWSGGDEVKIVSGDFLRLVSAAENDTLVTLTDFWTFQAAHDPDLDLTQLQFRPITLQVFAGGVLVLETSVTVGRFPATTIVEITNVVVTDTVAPALTLTGASVAENINDGLPTITFNTPVVLTPTFPSGHSAVFGVSGHSWDFDEEIENPIHEWTPEFATVVSGTPHILTIGPQSFARARVFVTMIVTSPSGDLTTLIKQVIVETD